ncbi:MAG: DUF2865 domain-containing protein [Hyphomicrobiaceae bacterium]
MSAKRCVSTLCAALACSPAAANAQGFFDGLFGFGGHRSQPFSQQSPAQSTNLRYREPVARPTEPDDRYDRAPVSGRKFRTLCVRTCDGYYFPISGSVTRDRFNHDAQICRRSCGSEAVLFYHPSSSGDATEMVDLTGRSYTQFPNAFRYRKQLVGGCKCRPEPWAPSELARHRSYGPESAGSDSDGGEQSLLADEGPRPVADSATDARIPIDRIASVDADTARSPSGAAIVPTAGTTPTAAPIMARPPRSSGQRAVADRRSPSRARFRPAPTGQSINFGFGMGGSQPQRLRWPGD